jgi:diacylglycerol kinase (ATP)
MKILLIANPISQKIDKQEVEKILSEYSVQYNYSWETHYTEKHGASEKIQNKIRDFKPDLVIVAGGDGTINLVGKLLLNSSIEIGIFPAGSANGLAYNLDIPNDFEKALKKILEAKAKPFDVIRINQKYYCLHLGDVGINAQTVKRFERERSKGIMGYGKHMIRELLEKNRPFHSIFQPRAI